ncbi:MAG: head-tail adaptor protein [Streptococcaceae bacterium]|jgi:hypothetical protein|nr:head-tail adaptor protein [Streptococcaceae bacterium]
MISSQKAKQAAVKTNNGSLRTLVTFYESGISQGIDERDNKQKELFSTWAEVYNPSAKDVEIMKVKSVQNAMTIRIRDPLTGYVPDTKHFVELKDLRYKGKYWQVADIRPDLSDRRWLVILLNGSNL